MQKREKMAEKWGRKMNGRNHGETSIALVTLSSAKPEPGARTLEARDQVSEVRTEPLIFANGR
jgi:hypothetical protein